MPAAGTGTFEDPRSYTPPHLVEEILSSRSAVEGARKHVTVLFCDIANSTGLAERFGAEAMHQTLDAFFERALGAIHRFEGTVNQFLGDGFMALFGAPLSHEDHARRAALAACVLRDDLRERPLVVPGGPPVEIRMGLNSGVVIVGAIGDSLRMDYTAIGDTTNLAARLQGLATPGDILMSDAARRAIGASVLATSLGTRTVKGKTKPVAVHRLDGIGERTPPVVEVFVGRDAELGSIDRAIRRVHGGRGGVLVIEGEAGMGKSVVLARAAELASAADVSWLQASTPSLGDATSYGSFAEVIAAAADGESGTTDRVPELSSLVDRILPGEADDVLPFVGRIAGISLPPEVERRLEQLDRRAIAAQVLRSSRRFFAGLATQRPTAIAIEDVHAIDGSSAELLLHLLPITTSVPLLIIATGRPNQVLDDVRRASAATVDDIVLRPLDDRHGQELVRSLDREHRLGPTARDLIVRRAGGNPLFVEELVRSLSEASSSVDAGSVVPETISDVIMARVDRLDDGAREALSIASVVGQRFTVELVRSLAGKGVDVLATLDRLVELDLVNAIDGSPSDLRFKHALIQESIYESLLAGRRRELHHRVAEHLEVGSREGPGAASATLAHHFAEAEEWDRAQHYLRAAGDHAGSIAAEAEALTLYERALATYARAFGDRWDPVERGSLERNIGEALFRLGRHDRAIEHVERALDGFDRPYPTTKNAVRRAIGREVARRAVTGWASRRRASAVIRAATDGEIPEAADVEILAAYGALSWMHYFIDPERYVLDVLLSLDHSERAGLPVGVARGTALVGIALDFVALSRLAARYHRRAIRLAEALDHAIARGEAYLGVGVHDLVSGDIRGAFERFEASATIFRGAGDLRGWGITRTLGSLALQLLGDLEASRSRDTDVLAVAEDSGDLELRAWANHGLGRALCVSGPFDEAAEMCRRAVEVYRSIPAPLNMCDALGDLADCQLRAGDVNSAVQTIDEAVGFIKENRIRGFGATQVLGQRANCLVAFAQLQDGAARSEALEGARRACRAALRNARSVPIGMPEAARARGTYEWLRGRPRSARRWWTSAIAAAERMGWAYEVGLAELELGARLDEPQHIRRAQEFLDRAGAVPGREMVAGP